jgi:hypothetical protein
MRSHIVVHGATTKLRHNPSIFKNEAPGSNPGAPTTNLQKPGLYSTMFRMQTLEKKICST